MPVFPMAFWEVTCLGWLHKSICSAKLILAEDQSTGRQQGHHCLLTVLVFHGWSGCTGKKRCKILRYIILSFHSFRRKEESSFGNSERNNLLTWEIFKANLIFFFYPFKEYLSTLSFLSFQAAFSSVVTILFHLKLHILKTYLNFSFYIGLILTPNHIFTSI